MTIARELYAVLGVREDATQDDIRQAYRRRAKVLHPDRGGDPDDFDALSRAHDTLGDPQRRARYDATGDVRGSETQPPESTRMMVILSQIIQNVVCGQEGKNETPDVRTMDVVEAILSNMRQMEQKLVSGIGVTQQRIGRNKEVTRRLRKRRRRADSPDLLRMVLRGQREELRRVEKNQSEELALHRRITRVFEGYDYDSEEVVRQAMQTWTMVGTR